MKKFRILPLIFFSALTSVFGQTLYVPGGTGGIANNTGNTNVGIGTSIPDQKLTVKGIIHAQEVRVDLSVPGPDYVFAGDYELPSLEQIRSYIAHYQHLPEVPSAEDLKKNGVQLGEMNMLLLKKVEELTLYVLELKKSNDELRSRVERMETSK